MLMDGGRWRHDGRSDRHLHEHAFHWQNRSYDDPLVKPWVAIYDRRPHRPRSRLPHLRAGNVAIEVEVEVVDKNGKRLPQSGDGDKPLLKPTENIVTVGVAPP